MDKSFTPGPWILKGGIKGDELFTTISGNDPGDPNRLIQVIAVRDRHPVPEHNKRRLADAVLMSEAPAMYELLKQINGGAKGTLIADLLARITPNLASDGE